MTKQNKIKDVLKFLKESKGIEGAERYGASLSNFKNTVAEHSWRLALMVLVISREFDLKIDVPHALSIALFHDLAEAKTGDIDGYLQVLKGEDFIKEKNRTENIIMKEMLKDISFGKYVYDIWKEYEEQKSIESRFVKALDKIEGFLHIAEVGVQNYIPENFYSTYADKAVLAFDETCKNFPLLKDLLDEIKEDLKKQFEKVGVKWVV